jgi:predicted double-glycine peptidase
VSPWSDSRNNFRQRRPFCRASFLCALALLLAHPSGARAQISLQIGSGNFALPLRTFRDIPFRTVVRQQYDYSCGSAALATLLRFHYGRAVSESEIFQAMYLAGNQEVIRKVGFSLLDMKNYLHRIGLESDGYRTDLADVATAGVPAITVISTGGYKHFVVIKGIRNGQVLVGDPALGLRKIDAAAFQEMWNGITFAIRDDGLTKAAFNAGEEWRPYAPGPLGQALDRSFLTSTGTGLPIIYQVLQLTPLSPLP